MRFEGLLVSLRPAHLGDHSHNVSECCFGKQLIISMIQLVVVYAYYRNSRILP